MFPMRLSKVQNLLKKDQKHVWYQDGISMDDYRLVRTFQFGKIGRNKLIYPNMIKEKQWKAF